MRDGEGLVEVEVAHISTEEARGGPAHLGIHVGAVHINLPAALVHDLDAIDNRVLVHAMRRGVSYHHHSDPVAELFAFLL